MKFPKFKNTLSFKELEVKLNEKFKSCQNAYFKDDRLFTRNGFYADSDTAIDRNDIFYAIEENIKIQPQEIIIDGKVHYIGYLRKTDGISHTFINVYLFDENFKMQSIGSIDFARTDDYTYYVPYNIIFYKGKATHGAGIYALVVTENYASGNTNKFFGTYELSSDFTEWRKLVGSEAYTPTIYYNGRGNRYAETEINLGFAKPLELESRNLINDSFYAYFSTDGLSNSFQLPLSNLNNDVVNCTYTYKKGEEFNWHIMENSNDAVCKIFGVDIIMNVNRKTGTISFYKGADTFPLPAMLEGVQNNLKIYAGKEVIDGKMRVFSSKGAFSFDSKILLYSNDCSQGEICMASYENPLYFKKDTTISMGDYNEEIKAVKANGKNVAVFKTDGIYTLKIGDCEQICYHELISGFEKIFYKNEKITAEPLNTRLGTDKGKTVKSVNGYFVFKNKENIYLMNSTGSNVLIISDFIKDNLKENAEVSASFLFDNYYAIVVDKTIYMCDIALALKKETQKICWHTFKNSFEGVLADAVDIKKKPILFFADKYKVLNYYCTLYEGQDIELNIYDNVIHSDKAEIEGELQTDFIDLEDSKIEAISLKGEGKAEGRIEVYDKAGQIINKIPFNIHTDKNVFRNLKFYLSFIRDGVSIKIVWRGLLSLKNIKIFYS